MSVSLPGRPDGAGSGAGYLDCELQLEDLRDLTAAVQRCRRLLDLDADPQAVTAFLAAAGPVLGPLARANPGRRVPGHVDGNELALRAVLGQQVSVAAARRLGARLVAAYGKPLERPDGSLTHCFPTAETLAGGRPGHAADAAGPGRRADRAGRRARVGRPVAGSRRRPGPAPRRSCWRCPGIGPWTAGYIRMRALSDPDAFLPA